MKSNYLACILLAGLGILHCSAAYAIDNDADGMADEWEKANGLDYTNPDDAGEDPDGDNISNVREFALKSNPNNANSPDFTYYVSTTGEDSEIGGSSRTPWRTIKYALEHTAGTAKNRVRIIVRQGNYDESFKLPPYVTLSGAVTPPVGHSKALYRPTYAQVKCNLLGGKEAALENLVLGPKIAGTAVLNIDDVSMRLTDCVFVGPGGRGTSQPSGVGIDVTTDRADGTIIERCDFSGFNTGVLAEGDFPLIRQSFFEYLADDAIKIVGTKTHGAINLGKADDPNTGWNSFDIDTIGGSIVKSTWGGTLKMENNFWKTNDLGVIGGVLELGLTTFDFDPPNNNSVLYSLLPGGIACTVTRGETNERVTNASVLVTPSGYPAITANTNGVYTIPALAPGVYTVNVTAPNFEETESQVTLAQSELKGVLAELPQFHTADLNRNYRFGLNELLRLIQFYNVGGFHCQDGTEDGYAPGSGSTACAPHPSDYASQNWVISLGEILRAIQFYNAAGYVVCESGEDGFCPYF